MARLRFPGRPGQRFDRLGVKYGIDESRSGPDATSRLIDNIHRGLQYFYELFGESDEDEEDFEGFTLREVRKCTKRLADLTATRHEREQQASLEASPYVSVATSSAAGHNDSSDSQAKILRKRKETVVYKATRVTQKLVQQGIAQTPKVSIAAKQVREVQRKEREKALEKERVKNKKEKEKIKKEKEKLKKATKEKVKLVKAKFKVKKGEKPLKVKVGKKDGKALRERKSSKVSPTKPKISKSKQKESKESESDDDDDGVLYQIVPQGELDIKSKKDKNVGKRTKDSSICVKPSLQKAKRGNQAKVLVVPKGKKVDTRAKQLLAKAKKGKSKFPISSTKTSKADKSTPVKRRSSCDSKKTSSDSPKSLDSASTSPSKVGSSNKTPKQFILPTVSSRSSRVIIPRKRFIEEDFILPPIKKPRTDQPLPHGEVELETSVEGLKGGRVPKEHGRSSYQDRIASLVSKVVKSGKSKPQDEVLPGCSALLGGEDAAPVLDQPLVLEGKRERKPSMKMLWKFADEDQRSYQEKLHEKKLENRKKIEEKKRQGVDDEGSEADFQGESGGEDSQGIDKFEKLRLEKLQKHAEATKRSGHNILRKAKLQLNRAALNRSKAALARSLGKQMKKAEREERKSLEEATSPVHYGKFPFLGGATRLSPMTASQELESGLRSSAYATSPDSTSILDSRSSSSPPPPRPSSSLQPECAVCGREPYNHGRGKYYGVPSCHSCRNFHRLCLNRLAKDRKKHPICAKKGKCVNIVACSGCRWKRCKKVFPSQKDIESGRVKKSRRGKERVKSKRRRGRPPAEEGSPVHTKGERFSERLEHSKSQVKEGDASPQKQALGDAATLADSKTPEKSVHGSGIEPPSSTPKAAGSSPEKLPNTEKLLSPTPGGSAVSPAGDSTAGSPGSATAGSPGDPIRGPRIKHVCRKEAVALGRRAIFPPPPEIRLSALPSLEKEELLKKDEEERPATPDSDDLSVDELINRSRDDKDEIVHIKKKPAVSPHKLPRVHPRRTGVRRIRCKRCKGCQSTDCGTCTNCLDKPKFGGRGVAKQACVNRKCSNPQWPSKLTGKQPLFKVKKVKAKDDSDCDSMDSFKSRNSGKYMDFSSQLDIKPKKGISLEKKNKWKEKQEKTVGLPPSRQDAKMSQLSLLSSSSATRSWCPGAGPKHIIKADYKGSYDLESVWKQGLALLASTPMCVRTVCYLCGSAGKHDLIYCNVCCEPFHNFCLEESERPSDEHLDTWCCKKCQFCNVCGRQSNLLQCDKCQNTYHPHCLGPNYPTKPSKKGIWVCTKCVKCKSCGATTPGSAGNATWTYDFSLCFECGKLMDKGNYCPVCHKCYADDDWESKMVQCAICEAWVHAKCEGLNDEVYQQVAYLPDDVPYTCKICSVTRPPHWEVVRKREMVAGFDLVLSALMSSKSAHHLTRIDKSKVINRVNKRSKCPNSTGNETGNSSAGKHTSPNKSQSEEKRLMQNCKRLLVTPEKNIMRRRGIGNISEASSSTGAMETVATENVIVPMETNQRENEKLLSNTCDTIGKVKNTDSDIHKTIVKPAASEHSQTSGDLAHLNRKIEPDKFASQSTGEGNCSTSGSDAQNPTEGSTNESKGPMAVEEASLVKAAEGVKSPVDPVLREASVVLENILDHISPLCTDSRILTSPQKVISVSVNDLFHNIKTKSMVEKSTEEEGRVEETPLSPGGSQHPLDLEAVKSKMATGDYNMVESFSEDLVRIIQYALSNQDDLPVTRRKMNNTVRSIFVKQMERCFPWFSVKACRLWEHNQNLPAGMLPDAVLPPSEDHTYAQWLRRETIPVSPQPSPFKKVTATPRKEVVPLFGLDDDASSVAGSEIESLFGEDNRRCLFCGNYSDDEPDDCGRLLYAGQDDWVHVNCALWSAEVFEEVDGSLQNVHSAASRGKQMKCERCFKNGATVGCCTRGCPANFHFMCARHEYCVFQEDKKVFCRDHHDMMDGELVEDDMFAVTRRVCVDLNSIRGAKKTWTQGMDPSVFNIVIGSMTVESLGKLDPLSDCKGTLYPLDFCATRIYWSTQDPRRRCVYTCRITQVKAETGLANSSLVQDATIIHDETHPEYSHDAVLALSTRISVSISSNTPTEDALMNKLEAVTDLEPIKPIRTWNKRDCGSEVKEVITVVDRMSPQWKRNSKCEDLSQSWPVLPKRPPQPDLTGLSPSTLRMLGLGEIGRAQRALPATVKNVPKSQDLEFCNLTKMVNSLNKAAAAASSKKHRSKSVTPDRQLVESEETNKSDESSTKAASICEDPPSKRSREQSPFSVKITHHAPPVSDTSDQGIRNNSKVIVLEDKDSKLSADSQDSVSNVHESIEVDPKVPENAIQIVMENNTDRQPCDKEMDTSVVDTSSEPVAPLETPPVTELIAIEHSQPSGLHSSEGENPDTVSLSTSEPIVLISDAAENSPTNPYPLQLGESKEHENSTEVVAIVHDELESIQENETEDAVIVGLSEPNNEEKQSKNDQLLTAAAAAAAEPFVPKPQAVLLPDLETKDLLSEETVPCQAEEQESTEFSVCGIESDHSGDRANGVCTVEKAVIDLTGEEGKAPPEEESQSNVDPSGIDSENSLEGPTTSDTSNCEPEGDQDSRFQDSDSSNMAPIQSDCPNLEEKDSETVQKADSKEEDFETVHDSDSKAKDSESVQDANSEEKESETVQKADSEEKDSETVQDADSEEKDSETVQEFDSEMKYSMQGADSEEKSLDNELLSPSVELQEPQNEKKPLDQKSVSGEKESHESVISNSNVEDVPEPTEAAKGLGEPCPMETDSEVVENTPESTNDGVAEVAVDKSDCTAEDHETCDNEVPDKRSRGKQQVVKTYPLRRTAGRLSEEALVRQQLQLKEASVVVKKLSSAAVRRLSQEIREGGSGEEEDQEDTVPLHDQIAQKIKAESLAKSAPSDEGPFKCPTCKRLYRTKLSYDKHVQTCDFEVSSDEEEEEEVENKDEDPASSKNKNRKMNGSEESKEETTDTSVRQLRNRTVRKSYAIDEDTDSELDDLYNISSPVKKGTRKNPKDTDELYDPNAPEKGVRKKSPAKKTVAGGDGIIELPGGITIDQNTLSHSNIHGKQTLVLMEGGQQSVLCRTLNGTSSGAENTSVVGKEQEMLATVKNLQEPSSVRILSEQRSKSLPHTKQTIYTITFKQTPDGKLTNQMSVVPTNPATMQPSHSAQLQMLANKISNSGGSAASVLQGLGAGDSGVKGQGMGAQGVSLLDPRGKEMAAMTSQLVQNHHAAQYQVALTPPKVLSETRDQISPRQSRILPKPPLATAGSSNTGMLQNLSQAVVSQPAVHVQQIGLVSASGQPVLLGAGLNASSVFPQTLNSGNSVGTVMSSSILPQQVAGNILNITGVPKNDFTNCVRQSIQPNSTLVSGNMAAQGQIIHPPSSGIQTSIITTNTNNLPQNIISTNTNIGHVMQPNFLTRNSRIGQILTSPQNILQPSIISTNPSVGTLVQANSSMLSTAIIQTNTGIRQVVQDVNPLTTGQIIHAGSSGGRILTPAQLQNLGLAGGLQYVGSISVPRQGDVTVNKQGQGWLTQQLGQQQQQQLAAKSVIGGVLGGAAPQQTAAVPDMNVGLRLVTPQQSLAHLQQVHQLNIQNQNHHQAAATTNLLSAVSATHTPSPSTTVVTAVSTWPATSLLSSVAAASGITNSSLTSSLTSVSSGATRMSETLRTTCGESISSTALGISASRHLPNKTNLAQTSPLKAISPSNGAPKSILNSVITTNNKARTSIRQVGTHKMYRVHRPSLTAPKKRYLTPNILSRKRKLDSPNIPHAKKPVTWTDRNGTVHGMIHMTSSYQARTEGRMEEGLKQNQSPGKKDSTQCSSSILASLIGSRSPDGATVGKKSMQPSRGSDSLTRLKVKQKILAKRKLSEVREEEMEEEEKEDGEEEMIKDIPEPSHSHPLIHSQKAPLVLPQPEIEEEVVESPLLAMFEHEEKQRKQETLGKKNAPHLLFEITSDDGLHIQADSWDDAWQSVASKVQDARSTARLKHLSYESINGLSMFGLDHSAVVYLIEQLYGAHNCHNYKFRYHQYELPEEEQEPEVNQTGTARSESYKERKPFDMFSFLLSYYRAPPPYDPATNHKGSEVTHKSARRATSMDLPMAMRFRHLREHAKEAVGVYRSIIHGRGLFCKRDIDAGEMVIEYAGEVIRSILTDKREKYYEGKGIGCYMFRIDDDDVVDATVHGNAARFINHSCDPNCYSKVINVDGKKHIVIFAMRAIKRGEELTYDYKFPIEEVKIPCTCTTRRCRKYLN